MHSISTIVKIKTSCDSRYYSCTKAQKKTALTRAHSGSIIGFIHDFINHRSGWGNESIKSSGYGKLAPGASFWPACMCV